MGTPARLARASLTRGRSRRKGPILPHFLEETYLVLTLVSVRRMDAIFISPNRVAPSHLPPLQSTQPPCLCPTTTQDELSVSSGANSQLTLGAKFDSSGPILPLLMRVPSPSPTRRGQTAAERGGRARAGSPTR